MSDDNYKDRRTQGRHATPGPKRGPAAKTMIGMPLPAPQQNPGSSTGLAGRTPAGPDAADADPTRDPMRDPIYEAGAPPRRRDDGFVSDKLYMEPPSEVFERTQAQATAQPAVQPRASRVPGLVTAALRATEAAMASLARQAPQRDSAALSDTLHASQAPARPASGAGHATDTVPAAHQTQREHGRSRAPRSSLANATTAQAPETWRNDVKRMAAGAAGSSRPAGRDLRLKLGADADEDHYRGIPKSRLPSVLLWLLMLGAAGTAVAYWADSEGGVQVVLERARSVLEGRSGLPPSTQPGATETAPAEGAQPSDPATGNPQASQPSAANPTAPSTKPAPPSAAGDTPAEQARGAAANADQGNQDEQARALADPEPPQETAAKPTAETKPAPAAPVAKRAEEPKPAAKPTPKPAAKPAARPAPRREPIVKVRPMGASEPKSVGSAEPPPLDVPPEPAGTPYAPPSLDPPAPEPR